MCQTVHPARLHSPLACSCAHTSPPRPAGPLFPQLSRQAHARLCMCVCVRARMCEGAQITRKKCMLAALNPMCVFICYSCKVHVCEGRSFECIWIERTTSNRILYMNNASKSNLWYKKIKIKLAWLTRTSPHTAPFLIGTGGQLRVGNKNYEVCVCVIVRLEEVKEFPHW